MTAGCLYLVRFWARPDAEAEVLAWLDGGHIAEVLRQPGFLWARRAALEERRCALRLLEARRVLADADVFLRWAGDEAVALRIEYGTRDTLGACAAGAQLRSRLIELGIAAGGALAAGMLPLATRAQAATCYPMLATFLAEKRRVERQIGKDGQRRRGRDRSGGSRPGHRAV